jgi:hypothetical protein
MSHTLPSRALPSRALPSRALPSRALPSRALPSRALQLISEYSKPVTHAEWRYSKPIITVFRMYLSAFSRNNLLERNLLNNIIHSHWFEMYLYIKHNGIDKYCQLYDRNYDDVYHIDGVYEAMDRYSGW